MSYKTFEKWLVENIDSNYNFEISWGFREHGNSATSIFLSKETTERKARKEFKEYIFNTYGRYAKYKIFSVTDLKKES